MAQSYIKLKKQGKKNSNRDGERDGEGWKSLKNKGLSSVGVLHKTGELENLNQLYSY